MKYYAYIRKSSEDKKRQIQSIPKQYKWCKTEAERRGLKIDKFFEDSSSAHKLNRKGFKDMISAIEKSKEPIGIITWKISRLARNPIDEGVIKYAFMRKKITHILARDREYRENENQIIMGVDFGQATQFSIELSKDVKEGMNKKVSSGYRPVKAPYGYINDPVGLKGEKKIFVDDKYFKPIQEFLKSFATGVYSVPELRKKMTEKGIFARSNRPFSNSSLYLILKRRFNCGEYYWQGKLIKGKHKPMITVEEYEDIQFLLGRDQKISQSKYQNYYSGFIKCSNCKSCITGYSKTKLNRFKGVSTYHYLKCVNKDKNCTQKPLTRAVIDNEVLLILQGLTLSESIIDFVLVKLEEVQEQEENQDAKKIQLLKRRNTEIENEITVLGEKLIKGIVKDDLYMKMNKKLEEEASLVLQKIKNQEKQTELDFDKVRSLFEFTLHAQEKFQSGSFEQRKKILNIIGSNFLINGEKLSIELSLAFSIIKKIKHLFDLENRRIELDYNRSSKGLKPVLCTDSLVWSSLRERLRTYFLENIDIESTLENKI
jgi:DNA invertase Pin-like site-specific DNA recombinase/cell division protein FtsB